MQKGDVKGDWESQVGKNFRRDAVSPCSYQFIGLCNEIYVDLACNLHIKCWWILFWAFLD